MGVLAKRLNQCFGLHILKYNPSHVALLEIFLETNLIRTDTNLLQ